MLDRMSGSQRYANVRGLAFRTLLACQRDQPLSLHSRGSVRRRPQAKQSFMRAWAFWLGVCSDVLLGPLIDCADFRDRAASSTRFGAQLVNRLHRSAVLVIRATLHGPGDIIARRHAHQATVVAGAVVALVSARKHGLFIDWRWLNARRLDDFDVACVGPLGSGTATTSGSRRTWTSTSCGGACFGPVRLLWQSWLQATAYQPFYSSSRSWSPSAPQAVWRP